MLSEDTIKQILFLSDKPREDALFADEVDIIQFARNIESYVSLHAKKEEHARCFELAASRNHLVAELLKQHPPK